MAIVSENKQSITRQDTLELWKEVSKKHLLRISLEKTEVMGIWQQWYLLNTRLERNEIKKRDKFCAELFKRSGEEVQWRMQAGAKAWSKVDGADFFNIIWGC